MNLNALQINTLEFILLNQIGFLKLYINKTPYSVSMNFIGKYIFLNTLRKYKIKTNEDHQSIKGKVWFYTNESC